MADSELEFEEVDYDDWDLEDGDGDLNAQPGTFLSKVSFSRWPGGCSCCLTASDQASSFLCYVVLSCGVRSRGKHRAFKRLQERISLQRLPKAR